MTCRVPVRGFGFAAREYFFQKKADVTKTPKHTRLATKDIPSSMSVFVPLIDDGIGGRVLLTKRSSLLRSHRGEVCFPGGKSDPGETPEETALRETEEEIGLTADNIELWGRLNPVVTKQLTSAVTPIVGILKQSAVLGDLAVNEHEVQMVFSAPVEDLMNNVEYTQFKNKNIQYKLPVFRTKKFVVHHCSMSTFIPEEIRIWGMSAVMLDQVLEHIAPSYDPKLNVAFY